MFLSLKNVTIRVPPLSVQDDLDLRGLYDIFLNHTIAVKPMISIAMKNMRFGIMQSIDPEI